MAVVARLAQQLIEEMIRHALEDAPVECCGMLAGSDGQIRAVYRAANAEASPYRFSIDHREQRRIEAAMDAAGQELSGFYHSHTGSEPRPSPTDIRMMSTFFGPPYVHFVVGVADPDNPEVRVFYIEDGEAIEHEFEVEE